MKGQLSVGLLVGLLIAGIVGVGVVLPVISDVITKQTTIYTVTNESLGSLSSVPTVVQTTNYPVVSASETLLLDNTTHNVTLTRNQNYTVVSYDEGKFNITTLGGLGGTVTAYADYQWHYSNYISSGIARTVLTYLPVIIAIVLFVAVAAIMRF